MSAGQTALAAHVFAVDRRRHSRAGVSLDTLMMRLADTAVDVSILNISRTGFMAVTEVPFLERDRIRIDIPTIGWLRGTIVWSLGERIGGQFLKPIDDETFESFSDLFEIE